MRPYLSHWMNLETSVGWGKYTWLSGLFAHGFGTFLKASVIKKNMIFFFKTMNIKSFNKFIYRTKHFVGVNNAYVLCHSIKNSR